jgi:hypothetical protein
MPTNLASLRDRVAQALEDPTSLKWDDDQLDEAIRHALDTYATYFPHRAIEAITLLAGGREIDVSSLSFTSIDRVWWDYDALDPAHPPHWRDFEVWPGSLLHLKTADLPAIGDVVRIWYTAPHTLEDLDLAAETTFPDHHASTLVLGATGYAALNRNVTILEEANLNSWASRNLREWAQLQLAAFRLSLERLARRSAANGSGIAAAPPLDRWDR